MLESPDNLMPIGMANQVGQTENGLALWRLSVKRADVVGAMEYRGSGVPGGGSRRSTPFDHAVES
jgi:hypothetical protein